jgi:excisionase family DNA binding protein
VSFETEIRGILREEIRSALRDMLPTAAPAPKAPAAYLSTREAAELVGVRPETVREWVASGDLPPHGAGKVLRVRRDQLEAFMASSRRRATAEVDLDQRARDIIAGRRVAT